MRVLIVVFAVSTCVAYVPLHEGDRDDRVKRSPNDEIQRLRNLSPSDRPSCQPGSPVPSTRVNTTARLNALRSKFAENNIHGYLIPSEDAHQSEYPSDYDLRREYISGMTGSAGKAVVLGAKAALWTDGRYFLQAEDQLDCNWILMKQGEPGVPSVTEWVKTNLQNGEKLGASPFLISSPSWKEMAKDLNNAGRAMAEIPNDLIDQTWTTGRPAQPNTDIFVLPMQFAGRTWEDKVTDVQAVMTEKAVDLMVVTGLDETAWLFNLRASDIQYNPFFLSYAILNRQANTTTLYIKDAFRKLAMDPADDASTVKVGAHLNTNENNGNCAVSTGMCVQVKEYNQNTLLDDIDTAVGAVTGKVWVSFACNYAIYSKVLESAGNNENKIHQDNTPLALQKAQKNAVEREGMKRSHIRDAVALITFMAKLEKEVKEGKYWTEVSAAADLKEHRTNQTYNRGLSFSSVSAVGSNAAIIHYEPTEVTNKILSTSEMYLIDSGAQYLDGTTDVTRTFHFGNPTPYEKECYTRVLMGHVDLAKTIWLSNMYGREIDAIARHPLWDAGLNYRHGTGHGIGMFLSVHEGPGRISLSHSSFIHDSPLDEFQFFSDEPGYYEDGKFGIRLENIVMVQKVDTKYKFPDTMFLGFNTITLVPYEPNLIVKSLLSQRQVDWINEYHEKVQNTIGPLIENDALAKEWLSSRTQKISLEQATGVAPSVLASFSILLATLGVHFFI